MSDDLTDDALMLARGRFATVRGQHEDAKKRLSVLCGELSSISARILRLMQPDNDAAPEDHFPLLSNARDITFELDTVCLNILHLAKQRAELKIEAWK